MSQETPFQLPSIDFCKSDLKPGTSEWDLVKSQVWKAISEHGCFKALFDKIPLHVEKSCLGEVKELFDLPLQTKRQHVSEIPFNSYFWKSPPPLQYESFGIEDPSIFENCNNFTNVLWPHGNPDFRKNINYFSTKVSEFEKLIRRMILESMGLDNYLDEHMSSTTCVLRVMKYQVPQITEPTYTSKPHTDKNLITILYQNQVDGLEVQTKHGEWIGVELSHDHSFVILIGESFRAWTNGRLHPPYHRVRMSGSEARYSAGLFSFFKAGYKTKTPEDLIDEDHPLLYKPFDYFEFLKFFSAWAPKAQPNQCALKAYCGV
ncbi:hypothetical protein POPTR_001G175800v4 [Populus trichocarpa]|uniref:Fe2OG dioxygenase domain-containing protein n=1 Tax=Populus trichocarpa TaxID=3694 RepID=B9GL03_POPTR|nr:probable 2-oxoglutarate-dependent dioxygenase AOP1 [Populus trichocarpa]PNT55136.1 hypothetical protein POPTR_001G175800v4 [Populus trichocarpa]|eukprot:XP_002298124.1 probable 2-oxoglutarate-dependent dioxygenase AOP1 [Populus trichocarpa]